MKRLIFLIFISLTFSSCLKDAEALKKEKLFVFFDNMKIAIQKEDDKWFKKNAVLGFDESNLFTGDSALKNFFNYDKGEYSVTINYNIGASDNRVGAFIIRNVSLNPVYYYIRLSYNKKNKWIIESIDKLPIAN